MKKNILYLSPQNVIPHIDGGKIGIYYPIKMLAKENNVIFVFLDINCNDKNIIEKYKKINITPVCFKKNIKDKLRFVIINFFSNIPFKMKKYYSLQLLEEISLLVEQQKITTIIASHAHMALYALNLKRIYPHINIILREHNIEYELVRQYYKLEKNLFKKIIAYWQFLKTKKYEIYLWKNFDKVIFISDNDIQEAKSNLKEYNNFDLLYDGYDNDIINITSQIQKNTFIFTGSLRTYQNRYNLNKFISSIWRKFVNENKECKLYITGNSDYELKKYLQLDDYELKILQIINLGFVKDINNEISTKEFFISPTYIGSGIRIKVLHALSLGKVIFTTQIDYSMVRYFKNMENIILYTDVHDFTKKYNDLRSNNELFKKISKNAKNLIEEHLNWEVYYNEIKRIIQ